MKNGYTEERKMFADDLRRLCIRNNWFTRGNNDEYNTFLNMAKKENITTDDIVELAEQIIEHSNLAEGETMTNIMFELASICHSLFAKA